MAECFLVEPIRQRGEEVGEGKWTVDIISLSEDWESEDWFALKPGNPLRYLAVARVPWLNKVSGMDEWGFRCVGCKENAQWPNHKERDFVMSTFRVHLEECGAIKDGVHHKDGCCQKGVCKARGDTWNTEPYWSL